MKNSNEIRFRPSGRLVIMQVSDAQDMKYIRKAMAKMLDNAYDMIKPDLVLFTGDNILGNHLLDARFGSRQIAGGKAATMRVMRESIDNICAPLEKRKIPFAMIYGNHDDRNLVSKDEQADIYRSYSMCLPMNNRNGSVDCDTYNIPVLPAEGDSPVSIYGCSTVLGMTKRRISALRQLSPKPLRGIKKQRQSLPKKTAEHPFRL